MTSTLLQKPDHFICYHVYRAKIWPLPSCKNRTILSATMSTGPKSDLRPLAKTGPFYLLPCLQGWDMTTLLQKPDHFICHHDYRAEIWPLPSCKNWTILSAAISTGLTSTLWPPPSYKNWIILSATISTGLRYDHPLAKSRPFYLPPCLQGWDLTSALLQKLDHFICRHICWADLHPLTSTLLQKLDHFICHYIYRAEIWPPSCKIQTILSATMSTGLRYDHPLAKNRPFYLPPCLQGWDMTSLLQKLDHFICHHVCRVEIWLWTPNPWSVTITIYWRAEIYPIYKLYCAAGTKLFHVSPSLKVQHLSWCRATDHAICCHACSCDPNT